MSTASKLLRSLISALALVLLCCTFFASAAAQETTGGLEGVVKDPSGAVVSNTVVQLTGDKLIGTKTIRTDASGYYRFTNIDPGTYTLTVAAPGFNELKRTGILVGVGRLPTIDLTVSIGGEKTVVEVSTETPQIDVTQSRTQTTVSRDELDFDPKGRSFESVIQFAPGARNEPLQGNGYSVDGATSSENGYLVDGMPTSALDNGQAKAKVPFEFIEEVQVKTSGIEAEYGGALGGVVNAVVKQGSNNWHGELLTYYEADPLDASPSPTVRFDPTQPTPAATVRTDVNTQYYNPVKDHYRYIQPGAVFGGYLKKDRLWLSAGIEPFFQSLRRTVNFNFQNGAVSSQGPILFTQDQQQYFGFTRLDGKVNNSIRVFGAILYQYYRASGTALPNADSLQGLFNSSSTSNPTNFNHGIGNVQPNMVITTGADMTVNSHLVATTKYGYFYNNYQDRGLPNAIRYSFSNSGQNVKAVDGTTIASGSPAYQPSGYANVAANLATLATQNVLHRFNQDLAYYKKGFGGQHNLKGGYQLDHQYYNIRQAYTSALVQLVWGQPYSPLPGNQPNCVAIEQSNLAKYGRTNNGDPTKPASTAIDPTKCMGNFGYAIVRDFSNGNGNVSENNQGLYIQDAWTVGHGVTANLGVRLEKETVPSFNLYPSGIDFGFGGKVVPRLGAAWDVFQDGKVKVFGSYGAFNDVFKLNLAIGSFGGNYWHNCYYALDSTNYSSINPVRDANGHYCSGTGGANFGTPTPTNLRFIENQDFRIAANDPANPVKPGVDPNLKPFRQHEAVFGVDYQLSRSWSVESRWTRRRVDHAIEDTGIQTANGEAFPISNPGEGIDLQPVPNCPTCYNQPKAARAYDGVEFRFTKVATRHWFGQFDYTYSKLRGNYSGLVDSDVADGNATTAGGIRATSPNNGRAFDEPHFQFTAAGKPFNGLLATDRPHTAKAIVYYRVSYLRRHESSVGLYQQIYSGTPLSTYLDVGGPGSYEVYPEGRGKWVPATADATGTITFGTPTLRRTPIYVQSDLSFTHNYKVSDAHEAWRLGFEANITNALNTKHAVIYGTKLDSPNKSVFIQPANYTLGSTLNYAVLEHGYDYQGLANGAGGTTPITLNSQYGEPTGFQTGRLIRLKAKFVF